VQLTLDRPVSERPRAQQLRRVTVREGDSLWRIAAAALPKGSSEPAIEAAWHRWYQTNRAVIGADPGLLQPGQVLAPPTD
jgi:nucleoid-associated protein YgaU